MFDLTKVSLATLSDLETMAYGDFQTARESDFPGAQENYAAVVAELQRRGFPVRDLSKKIFPDFDPWNPSSLWLNIHGLEK